MYLENIGKEWDAEPFPDLLRHAIKLLKENPNHGIENLSNLSDRGSNLSMVYLGDAYWNGRGVERNHDIGAEWYKKAAENGSIEGAHRLAHTYFIDKKYEMAITELIRISRRGFTPAMYCLGSFYHIGQGVEKNLGTALHYWKKASSLEHILARQMISYISRKGELGLFCILKGYTDLILLIPQYVKCYLQNSTSERLRGW